MSTTYDPLATSEEDHPSVTAKTSQSSPLRQTVFAKINHLAARWIYNPLGFKKFHNFFLFFILGGALFFFAWYHIRLIDINGYWSKHTQAHGILFHAEEV